MPTLVASTPRAGKAIAAAIGVVTFAIITKDCCRNKAPSARYNGFISAWPRTTSKIDGHESGWCRQGTPAKPSRLADGIYLPPFRRSILIVSACPTFGPLGRCFAASANVPGGPISALAFRAFFSVHAANRASRRTGRSQQPRAEALPKRRSVRSLP